MRFLPHVLVIEDQQTPGGLVSLLPKATPQGDAITVLVANNARQAQAAIRDTPIDVVLTDLRCSGFGALAPTRGIQASVSDIDVLCLVDAGAQVEDTQGLGHVVTLLWYPEDVPRRVLGALQQRRLVLENRHLQAHYTVADRQVEALRRSLALQLQQRTNELQEANSRLSQLTVTDDVTGLYNQRFLHTRLDEEFFRARRYHEALAVMMLDIDNFKQVNDTHDHLFGTRVLRQVGAILRRAVRETDMVIRYGGDEFVIILPHTMLADAKVVGERLRTVVEGQNVGTSEIPCYLTMSVGIAARDALQAGCGRDILVAADRGLYRAKATGRNCVVAARSQVATQLGYPRHVSMPAPKAAVARPV